MSMFFRPFACTKSPAFTPKVQRLHLNFSRTEARLSRRKSAGSSPRRAPLVHSRGPTSPGQLAGGKAHRTGQGADPSRNWPERARPRRTRAGRDTRPSLAAAHLFSQGPIGPVVPELVCGAPWRVVPGVDCVALAVPSGPGGSQTQGYGGGIARVPLRRGFKTSSATTRS